MQNGTSVTRATALLIVAAAVSCASGCASKHTSNVSLVDYPSVSATPPPARHTGLWAGPHAGGVFFVEIFEDGNLRTCLSAPPYYHAMEGKYTDQALHLEDGTRIEFRPVGAQRITIYSPPGKPVTTLERKDSGATAAQCLTGAADVRRQVSHWAAH